MKTLIALFLISTPAFADDMIHVRGDFQTPVINQLCAMPQPEHGLAYIWQDGKCVAVIR